MPAHYYQTVEMNQSADLTDLVNKSGQPITVDMSQPPAVVNLWLVENDRNKEYVIVQSLTEIAKTMDDIYRNANTMHNFHTQEDIQKAIQTYYDYSLKQVNLVNSYYNMMANLDPSRVIPFDPQAIPVFYIQFKDLNDVERGAYVYVGSWLAAQYLAGYYGYLVGNLPHGTKITYGKMTYEL